MIGRTLGGYRIIEQIGAGGMATVYKAYDASTDRYVALKILPEQYSHNPTFRERFNREARAIAKLEHPHILPVHGYGEEDGITYLVMRYVESGTLSDWIRQGPLSLEDISGVLSQVAEALDYAHERGILHRDVKPSNVLLDARGNCYLTDFGIAKIVEATLDLTGGSILGTPKYMSPEQCRGGEELTAATDQYSLGVVLYEMVTGRAPFDAETPLAVIFKHLNEPLPMPRALRPDLPESTERVLLKALAKDPADRYPTCTEMADAFQRALAEAPTQPAVKTSVGGPATLIDEARTTPADLAAPETRSALPRRGARRLPLWAISAIIGLVGLAVIGALTLAVLRLLPGPGAAAEASREPEAMLTSESPASETAGPIAQAPDTPVPTQRPTATAVPTEVLATMKGWEFDTGDLAEGWGATGYIFAVTNQLDSLEVAGGMLTARSSGGDPYFHSPQDLRLDASLARLLEIRMRVSAGFQGQLFYITSDDKEWSEDRSIVFSLDPGDFVTYQIDTSAWQGEIYQIRLDPTDLADVTIDIDYIRVLGSAEAIAAAQPAAGREVVIFTNPTCSAGIIPTTEDHVIIRARWGATTPELADDNARHLSIQITLDGQDLGNIIPYRQLAEQYSPRERYGCGSDTVLSIVHWDVPVGPLPAGMHSITTTFTVEQEMTDGFASISPGTLDPQTVTFEVAQP